jgi:predicted nucleic acid-binding protein
VNEVADLFVDTSGWGNLIDSAQPHHSQAATIYRAARQQERKIITTNYIIVELVALPTSPLRVSRSKTVAFIDGLRTSPYVEFVHVDLILQEQAWQLFKSREDKLWSLVDCTSFVVMKQRSILEAVTTDHHFEQAGYVRLLR